MKRCKNKYPVFGSDSSLKRTRHKGDDFLNDTSWLPGAVLAIVAGGCIGLVSTAVQKLQSISRNKLYALDCFSIAKVFLKARSLKINRAYTAAAQDPQDKPLTAQQTAQARMSLDLDGGIIQWQES